jgi:hypothetical protein
MLFSGGQPWLDFGEVIGHSGLEAGTGQTLATCGVWYKELNAFCLMSKLKRLH